jgi:putative FmdB family regulatory protein
MPAYEFKCSQCGYKRTQIYLNFDQMMDSAPLFCPKDRKRMEREPSAPAFTVKGYNAANGYTDSK